MRGGRHYSPNIWSGDWSVLRSLIPYFMEFRLRVMLALGCLLLAKLASVTLPFALKHIVDALDTSITPTLVLPLTLLIFYGLLRFASIIFGEIRDAIFGRVTDHTMHRIALRVFRHLHELDLEFHLSRKTGALSRDIERGINGISFLMRFLLFNILPTLLEIALVTVILLVNYGWGYAVIILVSVTVYITFSVVVTEWRNDFVRAVNETDSKVNSHAIDSLLNFETVKYFNNEDYEAAGYDQSLDGLEQARMRNRRSLAALNSGQAFVVSLSITLIMILAAGNIVSGDMTLGDLALVNAYMIQLFIPLNFLGFVYREIKRALADVEQMVSLLDRTPTIIEKDSAGVLPDTGAHIRFDAVGFAYTPDRQILENVSFTIPEGKKVAVVGPSGSGKSTLARLLFRFYDVTEGRVLVNGVDIREVTKDSLRRRIGIVPQDTVLFNRSIRYNIEYGRPGASQEDIDRVVTMAHLDDFISRLPDGLDTVVGERGLKVSGGEKQRIAIARMLLKDPAIMVFDEATSSLDSTAEKAILTALDEIAVNRTTLVIAHRLSTVKDADSIIVLRHGRIVETGTHTELLTRQGVYARMWELQQSVHTG